MQSKSSLVRLGFCTLVAPFFDHTYAQTHYDSICSTLRDLPGVELCEPGGPLSSEELVDEAARAFRADRPDALVLLMGTFTSGELPMRIAESCDGPLGLWAFREPALDDSVGLNSLCGVNLLSFTLKAMGRNYRFWYGGPHDDRVYADIARFVRAVGAIKQMRESRIGYVGGRAPGFYPCLYDEIKLRRILGAEVLTVGLSEVLRYKTSLLESAPENGRAGLPTIEGGVLGTARSARQSRSFETLKRFVEARRFDALTIRDWPELLDDPDLDGVWPAIGRLHDEVVLTGPEGDMLGTVTMMIENYLTGEKPFLCDMIDFDARDNSVVLWHYGAPESLARSPQQVRYSEDNTEVEFTLPEGPITLARLRETNAGYEMLIVEGEVLPDEMHLRRAAARVRMECDAENLLHEIIYGGWPHHVCAIHGSQASAADLREFCALKDIKVVSPR